MAEISASMVMDLRQRTGLGMMECKKALAECGGDMAKAEDLLRVKSGAKASKAARRIAAEGVIGLFVAPDAKVGAIVEVNCETDFVAKNDDFRAFAAEIAQLAAQHAPADIAALSAQKLASGETVEDRRVALVQKIGENMTLRRFVRREAQGKLASYVHGMKIGVLVDVEGGAAPLGKDLAMHIAASKPMAVARDGVPADVIEHERKITDGAGRRIRQAREHRRENGRGWGGQVHRRSDAAGPAVREGRWQADRRRSPEGARRDGARLRCCTSSAKGSRRRRTISRPRSRRWRRPRKTSDGTGV